MSQEWLKKYLVMKPEVKNIFNDLEEYLAFCKQYGYVFNEGHLYNNKTPWGIMQQGVEPKDNWRTLCKRDNTEKKHV
jgi:hypothetical protein